MADITPRTSVEIPWHTILKVIAAAAMVWLWLKLVELALVVIVAVLLAVTLMPIVFWFDRHRWPRWIGVACIAVALLALGGGFAWLTWSSISDQAHFASQHFAQLERQLFDA